MILTLCNHWTLRTLHKRVLHVVESLNRSSGGPSRSVPALYLERLRQGFDDTIATTHLGSDDQSSEFLQHSHRAIFGKLRFSPKLILYFIGNRNNFDVVNVNCFWNCVFLISFFMAKILNKKIILSTRGMLRMGYIKASFLKKNVFNLLLRVLLPFIDRFHVTSDWETKELLKMGVKPHKVNLIYNLNNFELPTEQAKDSRAPNKLFTYLYVGRMHPYKRVSELIDAYCSLPAKELRDSELVLVGPCDDRHYARLVHQKVEENLGCAKITVKDFLGGSDLSAVYRDASVFVMPSKSENFGMSIFEALQFNMPVIVPELSPWPSLLPEQMMQIVSSDGSNLLNCLRRSRHFLSATDENIRQLEQVLGLFRSEVIIKQYNELYEKV